MKDVARSLSPWVMLFVLTAPAAGKSWPTYLNDRTRSGATDEKIELPLVPLWTFQPVVPPDPAWTVPVVISMSAAEAGIEVARSQARARDLIEFLRTILQGIDVSTTAPSGITMRDVSKGLVNDQFLISQVKYKVLPSFW